MTSFFEQYDLIAQSGLFDAGFYLEKNPDVANAGIDPLLHYLEAGASEGRNPHVDFDTTFYLEQCAERGLKPEIPLLHFVLEGRSLGIRYVRPGAATANDAAAEFAEATDPDIQNWMIQHILKARLFDRAFYAAAYGLQFDSEQEGLKHFFLEGFKEGKRPNLYFDPVWYLEKYPDVRAAEVQPLFHFLVQGDSEGRQPSRIFDSAWYRTAYGIPTEENTLTHFLEHRTGCKFSPLSEFDAEYYGDLNKDVKAAGVDPFEHFLFTGFREGRNPSPKFNIKYYVKRYLGGQLKSNPFLHFLEHKHEPGVYGAPPDDEITIPRAVKTFSKPAPEYEDFKPLPESSPRKAKVLAYYLPQFHAFAENDEWWGKGFTEWTNIARGVSRFHGHYQPRIPRDLGFYSLEDALPTLRRQVELAKAGGVYGFVFYYYWFNGKRLMEKPVEQFLTDASIDMPFCLMWANENWTRRWDGAESEVLISQDYDPDDDERLAADFVRHFRDPRYIRVNGRPLIMIYRPGIIPDSKASIARWRKVFKQAFNENPIIIMAQAFDDIDPAVHGLDGAIEFPPHKLTANMPKINDHVEYLDVEFNGNIFSYDEVISRSINEAMPAFPLIKTAVPSWDNDARRQGTGLVLKDSTPAKYEAWLTQLIRRAEEKPFFGERFVCVNAWNEWCEAAYLEPDLHYGSAYLNATARAVAGVAAVPNECKLLLIGHDAFPSGAQHLLLNIARRLQSDFGVQLQFLLLNGGKLEKAYRDVAPVAVATDVTSLVAQLNGLKERGYSSAIVNTTAASHILPYLSSVGIDAITLVHELPRIIREKNLQAGAKLALELSRHVIFPSAVVRDQLAEEVNVEVDARMLLIPQGMYKHLEYSPGDVATVRQKLGIQAGEKLVLGIGYADLRKGFDLFLQLWRHVNHDTNKRTHFCWIGDMDPGLRDWLSVEIEAAEKAGSFHMPGYREKVDAFIFASDAFALTSREDPFPTVVHEALSAGLPIFVFDGSGGMPGFLAQHEMGTVVAYGDVIAMTKALSTTLASPASTEDAVRRKKFVSSKLDFGKYVQELIRLSLPQLVPVSVAVPNYNYAQFMPERLGTVFQQNYPVREVIVLDDCSTDDSLKVIPRIASDWGRKIKLLPNAENSGSVFAQWRKAAEAATGELLWIAEADDLSDSKFLTTVVQAMQADPRICLGFSDSRTINYDGSPLWESYKGYYSQQEPGALSESAVYEGSEFVRRFLSIRNLILNVSCVVWRRESLLRALDACQTELKDFRMAGDWRLYLEVLSQPKARIAYVADPLNVHRRHAESVTHALKAEKHIAEIAQCHELAARCVQLSSRIRAQQEKYLKEVSRQLCGMPLEEKAPEVLKRGRRSKTKA